MADDFFDIRINKEQAALLRAGQQSLLKFRDSPHDDTRPLALHHSEISALIDMLSPHLLDAGALNDLRPDEDWHEAINQ